MTPEQKQRLEAIKNEVCKELTGSPACDLIPMVWNPNLVDQIALRFAEAEKQQVAKELKENIKTKVFHATDRGLMLLTREGVNRIIDSL